MKRYAFTLIEIFVCLAIMAILLSIASVGLGAAREASRRVSCQNNQRQLGIALHQFVDRNSGKLPFHKDSNNPLPINVGPWFDLAAMLEVGEFKATVVFNGMGFDYHDADHLPSVFQCPSDEVAGCNYRACGGSGMVISDWAGPSGPLRWRDSKNGMITMGVTRRQVSELTDGLSNTAFASERLVSAAGLTGHCQIAHETLLRPEDYVSDGAPYTQFLDVVLSNWDAWLKFEKSGHAWHGIGLTQTGYNHVVTPNQRAAVVMHGSYHSDFGIVGPTSHHPGGVNLCKADGSVIFVNSQIDSFVWSAMATIADAD